MQQLDKDEDDFEELDEEVLEAGMSPHPERKKGLSDTKSVKPDDDDVVELDEEVLDADTAPVKA
jgi:hypothetical protein